MLNGKAINGFVIDGAAQLPNTVLVVAVSSPVATDIQAVRLIISAVANSVVSVVRAVRRTFTITASNLVSYLKQVQRPISATAVGAASLVSRAVGVIDLAIANSSTVVVRYVYLIIPVTSAGLTTVIRAVSRTFNTLSGSAVSYFKQVRLPRAASSIGVVLTVVKQPRLIRLAVASNVLKIVRYVYMIRPLTSTVIARYNKYLPFTYFVATGGAIASYFKQAQLPRFAVAVGTILAPIVVGFITGIRALSQYMIYKARQLPIFVPYEYTEIPEEPEKRIIVLPPDDTEIV
jgi:hypothetical protein